MRSERRKQTGSVKIESPCWSRGLKNENGWSRFYDHTREMEMSGPTRRDDMIESSKDRRRSDGHKQDRNRVTIQ